MFQFVKKIFKKKNYNNNHIIITSIDKTIFNNDSIWLYYRKYNKQVPQNIKDIEISF